jgi:hypothetical protein
MSRPKRWVQGGTDGVGLTELSSWRYFADYINQVMLEYPGYIFRGQAAAKWLLSPTLDRLLARAGKADNESARTAHLNAFQFATRGRRGPYPTGINSENEWWALGQHHGLATPLLDWTRSPFVGAFFAFASEESDGDDRRAIFALHRSMVETKCTQIQNQHRGSARAPIVEFVAPMSDENARLVSQGGLFTRSPSGVDIESWVRNNFEGLKRAVLLKITVPNKGRVDFLRSLNRMNINHLSLFPDLYGASKFCNYALNIEAY